MLKVYVAAVALAAAAMGAVAGLTVPAPVERPVAWFVVFGLLILLAEYLQVRHYHGRDQVGALNLMEGILAPLVLFTSGVTAAITCAVALAIADRLRSNNWLKVLFNVAQWVLAASTASLLVHALRTHTQLGTLGRAAIAIVVMSAINQVAVSTVLALASGATRESSSRRRALLAGFVGRLVSNVAGLCTGLSLCALYLWSPWLVSLGAVFVLGIDAAGRANAAVRADKNRLEGLQLATHALSASVNAVHALPLFLDEVRRGFEVKEAQLVLFDAQKPPVIHTSIESGYKVTNGSYPLAQLLAIDVVAPTHLNVVGAPAEVGRALAEAGHARALVAPLRGGTTGTTVGMLLLFDRLGMEGFEAGELNIASALARELVGFLERVELQHAIEEERRKLTDILENTSDGILSVDNTGCITSWNAGLAAMTGRAAEEMVGTRHFGLLRPRDAGGRDVLVEIWLAQMESGIGLPPELQIVTADGATVWLSCSYSRIPAGEGRSDTLVIVARNITQARELERLKDDFVAVVSHELRTPLVPIKGWAQTLLNRGDRLSDDQRRTAVQSILAQAQKLESLVLNILEASRIEAGRVDGGGVADAGAITTRLVEDTLAARPDRRVRLRPALVPSNVRGSSVWVERAVSNLLSNAIKYSPDDEPVDVSIDIAGDTVLIAVTDRGPGIAVEAQERIFERFERLEETRKQTGTGLGLYITRRLARAMGGDVTVSSVPGAGSTFLLRLPAAPVSTTRLPEPRGAGRDGEAKPNNVVNLR